MKLFQRKDYYEGQGYPDNVILTWGRKYDSGFKQEVVNSDFGMVASERAWIKNGFYVKVELPFIFTTSYIDPTSFTYKIGKVRPAAMFTHRRSPRFANSVEVNLPPGEKAYHIINSFIRVLKPLNPENDPLDVKKNIDKFGPTLTYSSYGQDKVDPIIFEKTK